MGSLSYNRKKSEVLYDCVNKQADKVPLQKGEEKHKNEVIASLRNSKVEVVNDDGAEASAWSFGRRSRRATPPE